MQPEGVHGEHREYSDLGRTSEDKGGEGHGGGKGDAPQRHRTDPLAGPFYADGLGVPTGGKPG
eukprot:6376413-Pyramimonas_sp.AAC.1